MPVAGGRVDLSEVLQGLERHQAKIEGRIRELTLQLEETRLLYKRVQKLKDADVATEVGSAQIELPKDVSGNPGDEIVPRRTQVTLGLSPSSNAWSEKKKVFETDRVRAAARDVLSTTEKPLDRQGLLSAFIERGCAPSVADPPKFIGKTLWKSDEFVHAKGIGSGYWLASRKLPDGYHIDEPDDAGGEASR